MPDKNGLAIVIQAGGQSSRMGQDKALMPFLGKTLIARQVERLAGLASELLITTNRLEEYFFLGLPLFADLLPGLGALGGLFTALAAAREPIVAVVGCDMPFIVPGLLVAEWDTLRREVRDVVIPRSPNGVEPLLAVYRREICLPAVRAALEAGERKMTAWFSAVRVLEMTVDEVALYDPEFHSFINVNSPEEFHRAEALGRQMENALGASFQDENKPGNHSGGRTPPA